MLNMARRLVRTLGDVRERRRLREAAPELSFALEASGDGDDRECWLPIERRRGELLASDWLIPFPEHGAGTLWPGAVSGMRRVDDLTRAACKPRRWAEVLFHLVRMLRPNVAIELGTCVGMSGAYQAAALKRNGVGMLLTFEGAEAAARIADEGFQALGLQAHVRVIVGRFADTLPGRLEGIAPIAYAFIDGHHEEQATLAYYAMLVPHLAPRALIVFDDIRWSPGMTRAWRTIADDGGSTVSVDCGSVGLALRDPAARPGQYRFTVV